MILMCKIDNKEAVDKYTNSGYKNNVILFGLLICDSMEIEPLLDIFQ